MLTTVLAAFTYAQDNDTEARPSSKSDESDVANKKIIELDDYIVTGTRMELELSLYPGSASSVDLDDLQVSNNIIESLSLVPGIETGGSHGRNIGQQFTIRGFGYQSEERVIVKLDGVRRSTALFSNHISSFRVDSDLLASVDVVKGASSVSHGGGAIGGVIGMRTKDARDFLRPDQTIGATTKARYETNNHKEISLALYGTALDDKFDYLLYAKAGKTGDLTKASDSIELSDETFTDTVENDEDLKTYFVKVGYNPNEDQRLTLSHYEFSEDTAVTWQTLYHSSYSTVTGPVFGDLSQKDTVLNYELNPTGYEDWINLNVTAFNSESYYFRVLDYLYQDVPTHVDYKNEDERYGINAKNLMQFETGDIFHRLLVGFDYEIRNEDALYVRNGVATDFGSMPNEYMNLGFYFQEEASMLDDKLVLHVGGRLDFFERDVHNGKEKYDDSNFSPRIGGSYEVAEGLNLLFNYSESFRAPTPHETSSSGPLNPHYWYTPNPNLKPERAEEYEIGFSYVGDGIFTEDDNVWFKVMYFDGEVKDMISFEELFELGESPEGSPYGTYKNVAKAIRNGLELEFRYKNGPWSGGFTFESLDQYDSVTREKEPSAFADKLRAHASYYFEKLNLTLSASTSHWFAPEQNPESVVSWGTTYYYVDRSFTITDIKAIWRPTNTGIEFIDEDVELQVGVNNIADDVYINARDVTTTSRVGKGRNIFMSLSKRF